MVISNVSRIEGKLKFSWILAEGLPNDNKIPTYRNVRLTNCPLEIKERRILAICLVKVKDSDRNIWTISRSSYRERLKWSLLKNKDTGVLDNYTPSLICVDSEGPRLNIKKNAFQKISMEEKKMLKNDMAMLKETCGIPEKDTITRTARVTVNESVDDKFAKLKISMISRYILQRKKEYPEEHAEFTKMAKTIANKGITQECLEELSERWKSIKGPQTKGCSYRIGAFIPNLGIVMQYTHNKESSIDMGWFPLRYGRMANGGCTLKAVKHINMDEFGERTIGVPFTHFRPRILCFLIHRGGKKIINGEIYDLKKLKDDQHCRVGVNLPLYYDTKRSSVTTDLKTDTIRSPNGKDKQDKNKLPISVMIECNKIVCMQQNKSPNIKDTEEKIQDTVHSSISEDGTDSIQDNNVGIDEKTKSEIDIETIATTLINQKSDVNEKGSKTQKCKHDLNKTESLPKVSKNSVVSQPNEIPKNNNPKIMTKNDTKDRSMEIENSNRYIKDTRIRNECSEASENINSYIITNNTLSLETGIQNEINKPCDNESINEIDTNDTNIKDLRINANQIRNGEIYCTNCEKRYDMKEVNSVDRMKIDEISHIDNDITPRVIKLGDKIGQNKCNNTQIIMDVTTGENIVSKNPQEPHVNTIENTTGKIDISNNLNCKRILNQIKETNNEKRKDITDKEEPSNEQTENEYVNTPLNERIQAKSLEYQCKKVYEEQQEIEGSDNNIEYPKNSSLELTDERAKSAKPIITEIFDKNHEFEEINALKLANEGINNSFELLKTDISNVLDLQQKDKRNINRNSGNNSKNPRSEITGYLDSQIEVAEEPETLEIAYASTEELPTKKAIKTNEWLLTNEMQEENETEKKENRNTSPDNKPDKNLKEKEIIKEAHVKTYNNMKLLSYNIDEKSKNLGSTRTEVCEKDGTISITIELDGLNLSEKEIIIRIIAPKTNKDTLMLLENQNKIKFTSNDMIIQKNQDENRHPNESTLNHPTFLQMNPIPKGKNIFEKCKSSYNKSNDINMAKNTTLIHRKGHLDIYNTGEKKEEINTLSITSDKHWYDHEWFHIYDEKNWYLNETNSCRKVSQHLREKIIQTMTNANANVMDRMWLNIPYFLEHPNKRELELMYNKVDTDNVENVHLAETQFYRGAWGKAYKTLTGLNKREKTMSEEEIAKLFPAEELNNKKVLLSNEIQDPERKLITIKEVKEAIKSLPNGKACGLSGGHYEIFKSIAALKKGLKSITRTCDFIIKHPEQVHQQLYTSRCIGIPKKDGGTRPLCVQESITKILHKVIAKKIERLVKEELGDIQKCLSSQEGQIEAWNRVLENVENDQKSFIVVFDFANAFGTISRRYIIKRLQQKKVPAEYVNYVYTMLQRQQIVYKNDNGELKWKRILSGVPQGEPLAMVLFAIGIDNMLQKFNNRNYITVTAYADDVVFVIKGEDKIESTITEFEQEAIKRGLRINMMKTSVGYTEMKDQTRKLLEERGIKVSNIQEQVIEYVGLPITLNSKLKEGFVKRKTKAFIDNTKALWLKRIPLQMKYHLQEVCLNSQLTYLYRAVPSDADHKWMKRLQNELDEVWEHNLRVVPKYWRRIPSNMYGIGLFNIKDRRYIARQMHLLKKQGKESEEKEVVKERYYIEKITKWKKRHKYLEVIKPPFYTGINLTSPPTMHSLKLDDIAFKVMLAGRYCSKKMDILHGTCPYHNKPWSLQHVLGCTASAAQAVRAQHDQIVQYISGILLRCHAITRVKREKKSIEQEERHRAGISNKRADILFTRDGIEHSVDVSITTGWSVNKNSNPILNALKRKRREYANEKNVHIILFDTNGGITDEALAFLTGIGASRHDLRMIQTIIYRASARRYQIIVNDNKNREYKMDRRLHLKKNHKIYDVKNLEC